MGRLRREAGRAPGESEERNSQLQADKAEEKDRESGLEAKQHPGQMAKDRGGDNDQNEGDPQQPNQHISLRAARAILIGVIDFRSGE
jgi:hypothetical protein